MGRKRKGKNKNKKKSKSKNKTNALVKIPEVIIDEQSSNQKVKSIKLHRAI